MKMYNKLLVLSLCILIGTSCQRDEFELSEPNNIGGEGHDDNLGIRGLLNIKLRADIIEDLDLTNNSFSIPTGNNELDEFLLHVESKELKRVFPYAGKHEHLQQTEGLHLWYTISVAPKQHSRAVDHAINNPIIDHSENVYRPKLNSYKVMRVSDPTPHNDAIAPFDDPLFHRQWSLYNDGSVGLIDTGSEIIKSSLKGADINIIPAWKETTGNSSIVVSVVDGGVDINHEDLRNNLWVNEGEIPNNGIDDDNNGFIDDVNGYNFVDNSGIILPHDHGTHVAGVIAATNNNGVGVSSIAGGDGMGSRGVKIMSCQIFKKNTNYDPDDENSSEDLSTETHDGSAAAIVYGVNNGAVISQNSWGYGALSSTPKVISEAISYFRKYAGTDMVEETQSTSSMMDGGVVLFAAGNDNLPYESSPSADPGVISVTSYAPDFVASWYTNYGNWVSLAAPGGWMAKSGKYSMEDGEYTSAIFSTLTSIGGVSQYGYMQGTSMACPHVAGIAALVVSKYGGTGFTNEELERRLLTGIKPIDPNNFNVQKHHNKVGRGFVDAHIALVDYDKSLQPANPEFVDEIFLITYTSIMVGWRAKANEIDKAVDSYVVYFADKELTEANFDNPSDDDIHRYEMVASYRDPEEMLRINYSGLKQGVTYYFAIESVSRNGNRSRPIFLDNGLVTIVNEVPTLTAISDIEKPFVVAGNDMINIRLKVEDIEGHDWYFTTNYQTALTVKRSGDYLDLKVFANKLPKGKHTITTTVTDEHAGVGRFEFDVLVKQDAPPQLIDKNISFDVKHGTQKRFDLSTIFKDENTESLTYKIESIKGSNATASIDGGVLTIIPRGLGRSEIVILITDQHDVTAEFTIPIFVYDNEGIYSIYPTPTSSTLYIKLGADIDGEVLIEIRSAIGKVAYSTRYNTNSIDPSKRILFVNVKSLFPGKYELFLTNNNNTYTESFIKK